MKKISQSIKFINLIKESRVLYDRNCIGYESYDTKNRLWNSIAAEVGFPSGDKAKQRWRAIRDRYVREKRILNSSSPSALVDPNVWPLMKYLTFLDGHIQPSRIRRPRPEEENVTINLDDNEVDEDDRTTEIVAEPCFVDCSMSVISDDSSVVVPVRPDVKLSVEEALTAVGQYFHQQANDIDAAFCQYVLTEMKQMSDHVKARFKKMILNYICAQTNKNES